MPDLRYQNTVRPTRPAASCRAVSATRFGLQDQRDSSQDFNGAELCRSRRIGLPGPVSQGLGQVSHFSRSTPIHIKELPMNLTVTGHHVDVTSSMRNYVTEKMERLQRHSENLFGIHVILSVEKVRQKAEATIEVAGTKLYADTTEPDMYAAIDLLTDKLDRQLIRHKEKQKKHRRDKEPDIIE